MIKQNRTVRSAIVSLAVLLGITNTMRAGEASTETMIFDERVKTLEVYRSCDARGTTGMPVLTLGDNTVGIVIEFDKLADDRDYLRYSLTHCDAMWREDQLSYSEYLDGFNEGTIDDYEFSQATTVHYVHYRLSLPNEQTMPTVSGNYLLKIYPEGAEDEVWLQCRFAISEQTASLGVSVSGRTDVDYNRAHQQLEIVANVDRADVRDIFNDLILTVEQNARTDNRVTLTKPLRVSASGIHYEHQNELIFEGGNEYRRFETVSKRFAPMGVDVVDWKAPYYRYVLTTDKPRSAQQYLYDRTLGGGFLIRDADSENGFGGDDPATAADYAVTYFSLEMPEMPQTTIFLDGDFVQRRLSPESAMTYNNATGCYEKAILLKQGAYSYQYLTVGAGKKDLTAHTGFVEGDHYETVNRYTIYLYNRRQGERYDRLVGYTTITTR